MVKHNCHFIIETGVEEIFISKIFGWHESIQTNFLSIAEFVTSL